MTSDDGIAPAANCHAEIQRLVAAVRRGQLDTRADATGLQGEDAATVMAVNEMLDALQVRVELGPEPFLELVGASSCLGLRLDEGLNGEEVDLHLRVIVHGRSHIWRREVVGRDDYRPEAHGPQKALWVSWSQVVPGLLENGPPGRDDHKISDVIGQSEQLHGASQDVGLPYPRRRDHHPFEWWLRAVNIIELGHFVGDRFDRLPIRLSKVEP